MALGHCTILCCADRSAQGLSWGELDSVGNGTSSNGTHAVSGRTQLGKLLKNCDGMLKLRSIRRTQP